jgi:hypothetical protein
VRCPLGHLQRRPVGDAEQGIHGSVLAGGMRVPKVPVLRAGFV